MAQKLEQQFTMQLYSMFYLGATLMPIIAKIASCSAHLLRVESTAYAHVFKFAKS